MCSEVQHFGGMWVGSVTDNVKMRFRQSWHIRWSHASFAVLMIGTSSDPQVRQVTFFRHVLVVGELRRNDESMLDPFFVWVSAMVGDVFERGALSFVLGAALD